VWNRFRLQTVAQRRTAVSSKCFQLYYTCSDRLFAILLPPCPFHLFFLSYCDISESRSCFAPIIQSFDGKAGRKEPLGRPRRRWEDGIRMDLRETGPPPANLPLFRWLRIGTGGWLLWTRWWTFGLWRHGVTSENFCSLYRKVNKTHTLTVCATCRDTNVTPSGIHSYH
jgi:hypothetical protein